MRTEKLQTESGAKHRNRLGRGSRSSCSQSGQALVELAFIIPVLLLLTIGVIEIGRYAYIGILVGNAARAGAAYGSLHMANAADNPLSKSNVQLAATNDFQNNGQTGLTVASITTCGCDSNGTISPDTEASCDPSGPAPTCPAGHWVVTIHVTGSGTFTSLFSYPGIPGSIDVSRTASMRVAPN
jgi:Flp pilus assembly protein TadG